MRSQSRWYVAAGAFIALLLFVVVAAVATRPDCGPEGLGGGDGGSLEGESTEEIPKSMARLYKRSADRWDLDVAFLASIGAQESNHGRSEAARQTNSSGCRGVMQLGTGGACGDFWGRNQCDGNNDGRKNIDDPADNVCASAKGLRTEKGAPPAGGSEAGYRRAACNYYGACGDGVANYAEEVMARAKRYGFRGGTKTDDTQLASAVGGADPAQAAECSAPEGGGLTAASGDGELRLVGDAKANEDLLQPTIKRYARAMAGYLPKPLVANSGARPGSMTTSGNVSDHDSGNAMDFGSVVNGFPATGGGYGDTIAEAALRVAGLSPAKARAAAKRGGAQTIQRDGLRIQIIWKTMVGGNHFNHVHVGVQPTGGSTRRAALTPTLALIQRSAFGQALASSLVQ